MSPPAPSITLRPATARDRFVIRRWLGDPEIAAVWGSKASAEAAIALALDSPSALCRVVEAGHDPIGYVQAVDSSIRGEPLYNELPAGCWDIELFIASPDHRGSESSRLVLKAIVEEVFATTLAVGCCSVVPVYNEEMVRLAESAGFRWQRVWRDPILGHCWLLLKERPG